MLRAVFRKGPWVLLINAGYKKSRRLLPAGFLAWGRACPPYGKGKNSTPRFPLFLRLPCLSPGLNLKNRKSPLSSRLCGLLRTLVNSSLAEGEGFEPPEGVNLQRFSRPPQSTALPPLRAEQTAPPPAPTLCAGPMALGGASSAGCRATAQGLPVRTARSI